MNYKIYIDGGVTKDSVKDSRGKGRFGFMVCNETDHMLDSFSCIKENATVPEMEIQALLAALNTMLHKYMGSKLKDDINIYTDSELVEKWMNGEYMVRAENIKVFVTMAKNLVKMLSAGGAGVFIHKIAGKENKAHSLGGFT